MMHENQRDRQFANSNKGQNKDGSYWEDNSSHAQMQSDWDNGADSDVKVGRHSERHPMIMKEYERSRLQATTKKNYLYSMNEEDESAEEVDLELDEEYLDEDDLDEDDEANPLDIDNELLEMGNSPDPDSEGYKNNWRRKPNDDANY